MLDQVIPIILALLGLSALIFVHELGHLIAAIQSKMDVEAFGIGFGRPLISFYVKGIRCNLCWIPFGGYVKIAGMDSSTPIANSSKHTFFSASAFQRMKVAIAGPLANILFAIALFFFIWMTGGREKPYSEITSRVGWIDPSSELYGKGLRSGDRIISYSGRAVHSPQDHIQAAMTNGQTITVDFESISTYTTPPKRLSCVITPYQHPNSVMKGLLTTGVLAPASFVVWKPQFNKKIETATSMPSVIGCGIKPYDRIIWADGISIFSIEQLHEVLNDGTVLVTVIRGSGRDDGSGVPIHLRIPCVKAGDAKLSSELKGELSDWQYMAQLQAKKLHDLWIIPYDITAECVVEQPLNIIDSSSITTTATSARISKNLDTLLPGDHIIAVQGEKISHGFQLIQNIQSKQSLIIVDRQKEVKEDSSSSSAIKEFSDIESADSSFIKPYASHGLFELTQSIGIIAKKELPAVAHSDSHLVLLKPITLTDRAYFIEHVRAVQKNTASAVDNLNASSKTHASSDKNYISASYNKLATTSSTNSQDRVQKEARLKRSKLVLGLVGIQDSAVKYNPSPAAMLTETVEEVGHTFLALITGNLSPKWMAGPIGIVDSIQYQWSYGGIKPVLYWLCILSINLALLNLLPLPALDGGYIALSLIEIVTGTRPSIKLLEKIVLPFVFLLIILFTYLTYNDISRLIMRYVAGS